MILVHTRTALREALARLRREGGTLGLVPTMGYLHEGHLSLVDLARKKAGRVAVSIFVNPLQFAPGEDLARYPRDLERDLALLEGRGTDLVFHPDGEEMYPGGEPLVTVDPGPMALGLCGASRPAHFRGVLTVVARLFGLFRPEAAVFGQKDYQQAVLIRRMARDLEMEVEVLLGPIVREGDGLALSSRNLYLGPEERKAAPGLYRALLAVQGAFDGGQRSRKALLGLLAAEVGRSPLLGLEYGEAVHPETLDPVDPVTPGTVVALAARCGGTRLLDNHILGA